MFRKPGVIKGLLVVGSTLCALLLIEVGLRVHAHLVNEGLLEEAADRLDPGIEPSSTDEVELGHIIRLSRNRRIVYELKPGLNVRYTSGRVTTDGAGFRCTDLAPSTDPSAFTIVGLGDSFMFGYGVSDEESYLARLAAELHESLPDREWRIVNTAVPGYNTTMEVETLRAKGLAYNPDLVLIEFVSNDLDLPNFVRIPAPVLTLKRSFLVDRLRDLGILPKPRKGLYRTLLEAGIDGAPRSASSPDSFEGDPERVPEGYGDMVGWDAYRVAMAQLRDLGATEGFRVAWISNSPHFDERKLKAQQIAQDLGFAVIDSGPELLKYLRSNGYEQYLGSQLALSAKDGHPSSLGHRVISDHVFARLLDLDLLRSP